MMVVIYTGVEQMLGKPAQSSFSVRRQRFGGGA